MSHLLCHLHIDYAGYEVHEKRFTIVWIHVLI